MTRKPVSFRFSNGKAFRSSKCCEVEGDRCSFISDRKRLLFVTFICFLHFFVDQLASLTLISYQIVRVLLLGAKTHFY